MQIKLSPRLAAIAKYVFEGSTVADIGTDHGYLPVYLMTQKISPRVVATDIHEKPLDYAIELVEMLNLNRKIDIRLGDGLRVLEPGEAEIIVLAGMGGGTITHILSETPEVLTAVKRIIFQPMVGALRVRKWLGEHSFKIVDEDLVEDDNIIYEIIVAEHGSSKYSQEELLVGPCLLEKKPALLYKYLGQQCMQIHKNVLEMQRSSQSQTLDKKNEYEQRLEILNKVIKCR